MNTSIERLYELYLQCVGVSTDSRSAKKGDLFFGLSGPNFNGNQYATSALEKGAAYAVVDDAAFAIDERIFLVEDALVALQDLARHHRRLFTGPVIGITGSNGKTTTKELVRGVMERKYEVHATRGNFNNHIGYQEVGSGPGRRGRWPDNDSPVLSFAAPNPAVGSRR